MQRMRLYVSRDHFPEVFFILIGEKVSRRKERERKRWGKEEKLNIIIRSVIFIQSEIVNQNNFLAN